MNALLQNIKQVCTISLVLIAIQATLIAQQTTYIGSPSGGDWFTATNWDLGLPKFGKNALITGGNTVNIPSALDINFEINNFGTLNASAPLVVIADTGIVNNSGTLNMNTGSSLVNNHIFQNNSAIIFAAGTSFTNEATGSFPNNGTVTIPSLLINRGNVLNQGTINATNGTIQQQGGPFTNGQLLSVKTLSIASGSTFVNEFGSTLTIIGAGASFDVLGNVTNNGIVNNTNGAMTIAGSFTNNVTLNNLASLTINLNGTLTNSGSGLVDNTSIMINNGTFSNSRDFFNTGTFTNNKTLNNNNTINNKVGGTFLNNTLGTLIGNFGSVLLNRGVFTNRNIINTNGGTTNEGVFTNEGAFTNNVGAVWLNKENFINNGTINSIATLTNDKTFTNAGMLNVNSGSIFTNNLTFTNSTTGTVTNNFEIVNKPGATLTNNGVLINNIRMFLEGTSINNAYWANVGDITIKTGGSLDNNEVIVQTAGNILNQGTLTNTKLFRSDDCSTINNKNGTINNISGAFEYSGIFFQRGTLSGLPLTSIGGYLHTNPTSNAPSLCLNKSISADVNGDVKVYATEVIAFQNFDSCQTIIYRANGEARPLFACSDIGTVKNVNIAVTTRLGDSLTCVSQVTPIDILAPQFSNCPIDMVIYTAANTATATWIPPTAVDNCSAVTLTSNFAPGSSFSVGITGVTYTAIDAYSKAQTCQFKVDVIKTPAGGSCSGDNAGPVFANCPPNINLSTNFSSIPAVWTTPTVSDPCLPLTYTTTAVPGTVFQLGTTTVKYTAKDGNNNTSTCQFSVTVTQNNICATDIQKPIISNCPGNVFALISTTINGAVALWKAPNVGDNCALASTTTNFLSGTVFPLGATTVTYTATDASGNTNTCSFVVTVATTDPCPGDISGPVISGCPTNMTKTITSGNTSTATWSVPTASDVCTPVTLHSTHTPGAVFPLGNTSVVYQASDKKGNKSTCAFLVAVVNVCDADTTKPVITACPENITVPQTGISSPVTWSSPTASDNCALISFNTSCLPGASFPVGSTLVGYTATDLKGNISACTFLVNVIGQASCTTNNSPINAATNINAASAPFTWNAVTNAIGYDVYLGTVNPPTTKVGTDIVGTSFNTAALLNNTPYFWYIVPKTVGGSAQGCASTATTFTTGTGGTNTLVNITCPTIVTVSAVGTSTTAVANYALPSGTSNCPTGTVSTVRTVGLASGSAFPVGSNQVCFTATDGCGSTKSCCFNVVVNSPVVTVVNITCPANVAVTAAAGATTALATYVAPTTSTTCTVGAITTTRTAGLASGAAFPIGTTQVCYIATDGCGNTKSCCFNVVVTATPSTVTLNCPPTVTETAVGTNTTAVANYVSPSGTSNCPTGTVNTVRTVGLASGSAFPVGSNQVCFTATDGCGSTKSCCFNVVVNSPVVTVVNITCPANVAVTAAAGATTALATYAAPTTSTTCTVGAVSTTLTSGLASGAAFPIGTTQVCYTATDGCGNTKSCCFNVVVNSPVVTAVNITCPANVAVTAAAGATTALATYAAPTTSTTCTVGAITTTRTAGLASGAAFPIGTTQVCYTATDGCGNTKTCCFNVTINSPLPAPNCDNITVLTAGNSITVNGLTAPITQIQVFNAAFVKVFSCSGTCSSPQQIISNLPNGSYLVKVKFFTANWSTICSKDFNVSIGSIATTLNITCPTNIILTAASGNTSASAIANYSLPTTNTTCTTGTVTLNRTAGLASGSSFPLGNTQVCYTAFDGCGNTKSCCFSVLVNAPTTTAVNITCPANITLTAASGTTSASAIANYTTPTTNTTCTTGSVMLNRTAGPASGSSFPIGNTQVCYTATDGCGNTKSCCFSVLVNSPQTTPSCDNIIVTTSVNNISVTGLTSPITQVQVFNSAYVKVFSCSGNCSSPQQMISNLPNGPYFVKVKLFTSTWGTICSRDFNVVVNTAPSTVVTLTCPSNIMTTANQGGTSAIVSYSVVSSSNCTQGTVALNRTSGFASGTSFPLGTTQVCYTATDACGSSKTCCFNVTVNAPSSCAPSSLVLWTMDACNSTINQPSSSNYSEFTPTYQNNSGFTSVSATNVSRTSGTHSCTLPRAGATGVAMCVSGLNSNTFVDNSPSAIRFSVTLNGIGTGKLNGLSFWNISPTQFALLNGTTGTNDYPRKFGVRILKNGVQIYKNVDFTAAQAWTFSDLNFATLPEFTFIGTATFAFELLAYNSIGNAGAMSVWSIDDIRVNGCNTINLQSMDESLSLQAVPQGEEVALKWISSSKQPTKHFVIERSEDGQLWYEIAKYDSYGEPGDMLQYSEMDNSASKGEHHYRVVQYNQDASLRYSNVQKIHLNELKPFALFPNPAVDKVTMELSAFKGQNVKIDIVNALGIEVYSEHIEDLQDNNYQFSLQSLHDGFYTVVVKAEGVQRSARLLVSRNR